MHAIARSNHAACHSFFTLRRAGMVAARRSTALVFTWISSTQSRFSGIRRFAEISRPYNITGTTAAYPPCSLKLASVAIAALQPTPNDPARHSLAGR
jgi:hypothetical protein